MNRRINIYEEASRCLLCQDAPCTKACKTGDPARAIRAIRFDNHKPALSWVKACSDADLERAEQACIHYNWPIRIKEMLRSIHPDDVDVRPIALRHILELAQMPKKTELSGIGGIETWRDALEFIQLGCSNVQVCTAVMQYGYRIIDDLMLGLWRYMAKHNIDHLQELVGELLPKFIKPIWIATPLSIQRLTRSCVLVVDAVRSHAVMAAIRLSSSTKRRVSPVSWVRSVSVVTSAASSVPRVPSA